MQAASIGLTMWRILGLLTVALSLGCGQLLFKLAAERLVLDRNLGTLVISFASLPMIVALAMYGLSTILWVYLLHGLPLSRAYPFLALAFALVPVMSWLVFGDSLGVRYLIGLVLMLTGLYLVVAER